MKRKNKTKTWLLLAVVVLIVLVGLLMIPSIQNRLSWRWEIVRTYFRGVVNPVSAIPTANITRVSRTPPPPTPTTMPTMIAPIAGQETATATLPATPTDNPLPESVQLNSPAHELQDINNCGPATLAMYLRYYGWGGDQFAISDVIKPIPQDRNVNVEELDYYVKNHAGWLKVIYRVGGNIELLKRLVAAGMPVVIEETFYFDENFWPNDDRWAGHYLLVNGYDDGRQQFLGQDSFVGPNQWVSYEKIDEQWQAFNRVYIVIYTPDQEGTLQHILGEDWDVDVNRQNALDTALRETQEDPENVFAWFNLGTNYVYFSNYDFSARAYDRAREIGWPQRMLRYQFGPFMAYFHSLRTDDLLALTEYALDRTPNSEEALLWNGWGLYRKGDKVKAIESFQSALAAQPNYLDAQYALNYVISN